MTLRRWLPLTMLAGALTGALSSGCGAGVACGDGTRLEGSECVPAALASCPAGQALVNGTCTAICRGGTEAKDGACVVAASACGPGTERVDGTCRVLDPMRAVTVREGAEPNAEGAGATTFTLPAAGAAPVVLGGTIGAAQGGKPDLDGFVFAATAGQRIVVDVIAVGAPSAGVVLLPLELPGKLVRYVASTAGRGASRELVLPFAGNWLLQVSEPGNLAPFAGGAPRGGDAFTYTVTVSTVAAKPARPLAVPSSASGALSAGEVYELANAGASASIVELSLGAASGAPSFNGVRSVWATSTGGTFVSETTDRATAAGLAPMGVVRVVVPPGGLRVGVDYSYDLGGAPDGYALTAAGAAPEVVQPPHDDRGDLAGRGSQLFAFGVPQGRAAVASIEVSDIGLDAYGSFRVTLYDPDFQPVSTDDGSSAASVGAYLQAGPARRYYVVCEDQDFLPTDTELGFQLSVELAEVEPVGPVAVPGGDTAQATVATDGGKAYFAVSAAKGAIVDLQLAAASDARIAVLGSDFRERVSSGYTTTQGPELPGVLALGGGSLVVEVEADSAGPVTLTVTTRELAFVSVSLASGSQTETGDIATSTEVDYYAVTVPSAGKLRVETGAGATASDLDTYLVLFDATGAELARNDDNQGSGSYFSLVEKDVAAGTVYVAVSASPAAFSSATGPYEVSFALVR